MIYNISIKINCQAVSVQNDGSENKYMQRIKYFLSAISCIYRFLAVQNSSIGDLVPCLGTTNNQSLQKKSTINAQYPQKLCMKYNKYFKHNPNAFFQLVRVVIIIYKKYISVLQNISSKTLEQCNDYFCINKCLVQQLHCLLIVKVPLIQKY